MPKRPKTPCCWPGCPALTDTRYCEDHSKKADQNYRRYGRDPKINARYNHAWRKIRNHCINAHPLCAHCEQTGRVTPATEVDHIIPLEHGGTHDPANLRALCKPCHSRQTARDGDRWRTRVYKYDRQYWYKVVRKD